MCDLMTESVPNPENSTAQTEGQPNGCGNDVEAAESFKDIANKAFKGTNKCKCSTFKAITTAVRILQRKTICPPLKHMARLLFAIL